MLQSEQVLHKRYRLKQKLGQNAGRQTWLAEDVGVSPPELVVLKLLAFGGEMQWDDLKLFEREAQVLKHLAHPQIPKYRDYFHIDERLLWFGLVQEYIPGSSLKEQLNQGKRFNEKLIRKIAVDVLNILEFLHQLNPAVLHRDIKPSNLIWGKDDLIYLVDFGAVQERAAKEGATFTVVGTYGYAPMEQFGGRAVPASDLYALGTSLIHLITGTPPSNLPQQNLRICFQDRVSLSPSMMRWIETLTEPPVEKRYSSASEALLALNSNPSSRSNVIIFHHPGNRIQIRTSASQFKIEIEIFTLKMSHKQAIEVVAAFIRIVILATFASIVGGLILMMGVMPFISFFSQGAKIFSDLFQLLFQLLVVCPGVYFEGLLFLFLIKVLIQIGADINKTIIACFGSVSVYFIRGDFEIVRRLFGITYRRQKGATSDVKSAFPKAAEVFIQAGGKHYSFPKDAEVIIQSGAKHYSLAEKLTTDECWWLSKQIQNILHLHNIKLNSAK